MYLYYFPFIVEQIKGYGIFCSSEINIKEEIFKETNGIHKGNSFWFTNYKTDKMPISILCSQVTRVNWKLILYLKLKLLLQSYFNIYVLKVGIIFSKLWYEGNEIENAYHIHVI